MAVRKMEALFGSSIPSGAPFAPLSTSIRIRIRVFQQPRKMRDSGVWKYAREHAKTNGGEKKEKEKKAGGRPGLSHLSRAKRTESNMASYKRQYPIHSETITST
eukprot:3333811-Rhodomonas_salina.1